MLYVDVTPCDYMYLCVDILAGNDSAHVDVSVLHIEYLWAPTPEGDSLTGRSQVNFNTDTSYGELNLSLSMFEGESQFTSEFTCNFHRYVWMQYVDFTACDYLCVDIYEQEMIVLM